MPWQADFNECSTQDIDITYAGFNSTQPESVGDPVPASLQTTFWWPAHRPLNVFLDVNGPQRPWSRGVPASELGDLFMVTAWKALGFVREKTSDQVTGYVEVERNPELEPRPPDAEGDEPDEG